MKINAQIIITCKTIDEIDALYNAVKPEIINKERTQLKIRKEEKKENNIVMDIHSEDAVAFKATLNSISQMLTVFEKMKSIKQD